MSADRRGLSLHDALPISLTQNAKTDEAAILQALRQGQSYVSFDLWNDPTGFSFTIYDEKNKALPGGEFTRQDRKSTRLNSSHPSSSYAVYCWQTETDDHE